MQISNVKFPCTVLRARARACVFILLYLYQIVCDFIGENMLGLSVHTS